MRLVEFSERRLSLGAHCHGRSRSWRDLYTSQGATSGGPMAIQDAGGTWYNLVLNGPVNPGWFGATGNAINNQNADGNITNGSTAFTSATGVFTAADVGKPIMVLGASTGANFGAKFVTVVSNGGSSSYAPGDTITLNDGASTTHGVLTVNQTRVISATIGSAGTFTGTTGTANVTGTTGNGQKFVASCTLTNGSGITAVLSISTPGSYISNPTVLTAEPVTAEIFRGLPLTLLWGLIPQYVR